MPARTWLRGAYDRYIGVELPGSAFKGDEPVTFYARGERLPLRDASVDTVLGLSVLTYMAEPLSFLMEARRVLKPGGSLVLEFTQMAPLHDAPHDYFRFTRFGALFLVRQSGLEPVEIVPVGGLWSRVGLSLIAPLNRLNRGPIRILTELPVRASYVVVQLGSELLDRMFSNPNEVLAHLIVARRPASSTDGPVATPSVSAP
jgi:SAM-dependent methyltransferase